MKAAVNTSYGPPEVVRIAEIDKPQPKENEILVKVFASTVNRTDCGFRSAEYFISRFFSGLFRPKNPVLGSEFAGVVESTGKNVTLFKAGEKVFGYNDNTFGAHAAYLVIDENKGVCIMPQNMNFEEAAPISEGAHYALCIIRSAGVEKGQKVLVNGASGGIGSAAVQLLKYFGAQVTAVCNSKNIELVKSLGAERVLDYTREDFTELNTEFDFVFDAVGKSSFGKCKKLLKKNGIYISTELGKNSENVFLAMIAPFRGGKKVKFPLPQTRKEDISFLKELVESGKFKPVIDRIYPLDQIVEAYTYVETGQKTGNVVIRIE